MEQRQVTAKELASYLLNALNNNPSMTVPARESEYMTAAKQWLAAVVESQADSSKDTPEETEDKPEGS